MRFWSRCLVFLPDLDRFVALRCNHSERGAVEKYVKDGGLTRERAWLQRCLNLLKVMSTLPVEEIESSVVSSTHKDIVSIQSKRIDYS